MYRLLIVVLVVLSSLGSPYVTNAQPLGQDGQLKAGDNILYSKVEMNCLDVKLKLTKVYEQDGLSRVNSGQVYDTMSHRLMARLNTKVVENRLNGGDLVKSTADFEKSLVKFRTKYQDYEVSMNRLLKSDCQSRQHAFYLALEDVRSKRADVHNSVAELNKASKDYYDAFVIFRKDFGSEKESKDETN